MTTGRLTTVVEHLRRATVRCDRAACGDADLLAAFLARRDAAAFEILVQRHAGMVLGVCRRVLGDADDAEDAFQTTFLVLVRRAAAIVPPERVGNWLYGVAYKTALAARRGRARRRAREKQVCRLPHPASQPETPQPDLRPFLDQELSRLPEQYRVPIVLCDLEGRTLREVARQLAVPVGTLSNRLATARARLGSRLTRHGLALATGVTAVLASQGASAHVPVDLIAATVHSALRVAATPAALAAHVTPQVAHLTQGVLQTMGFPHLKYVTALLLTVGMLGAGAAWSVPSPRRQKAAVPVATPAAPQKEEPKPPAGRGQELLNEALKEFNAAPGDGRALRHRLLADMAVLQSRLGDRAAARKLFAQAHEIVAAREPQDQAGEWRMIARTEASAGEVEDALATARRILATNQFRDITLQEVATELADKRLETDALRVGAMIEDPTRTPWIGPMLLEHVALAHAKAGELVQALRVIDRMQEPSSQVTALTGVVYFNLTFADIPETPGVALLQASAGDKTLARKTLLRAAEITASIRDGKNKARPLAALACAEARLGDFDAARKTTAGISHDVGKTIALGAVVRALGKAGRSKDALVEIDKLPVGAMQVHGLTHLGAGQAQARDKTAAIVSFDRAHFLLAQLPENERRSLAYNLASARALAGDDKGALATAKAYVPDNSLGSVSIAYARAENGDFAGALEMVQQLKDSEWWKGNVYRAIAKLQTERGQSKAAHEWIARLDSPLLRANALFGVAEGVVAAKK